MKTTWIVALVLAVAAGALWVASAAEDKPAAEEPAAPRAALRVGTYDNRAIAVAFAHSKYLEAWLQKMKAERDAASEAGDTKKVEAIEAHGSWEQRKMHYQGFGHAPVGDLLAHIKDRLPDVALKAKVDVIAWEYDFLAPGAQKVDITDLLVEQFAPKEKALRIIEELKTMQPIPLEEIDRHGHDH